MIKQKYAIEQSLHVSSRFVHLLQLDDLSSATDSAKETGARYNLYFILERDRITLQPESVKVEGGFLSGTYLHHAVGGAQPESFRLRALFDSEGVSVESPYPHTSYVLRRDGDEIGRGKFGLLLALQPDASEHVRRFDVVYVGQAQIGGSDAVKRLASHETLQKIQHDVMTHRPHREIWLLLIDVEPSTLWVMTGGAVDAQIGLDESLVHAEQVDEAVANEREQLINVAEAGLIRYFRPPYNSHYKASFPAQFHKGYRFVYELDINSVEITITTFHAGAMTASETVAPSLVHSVGYKVRKDDDGDYLLEPFRSPINTED